MGLAELLAQQEKSGPARQQRRQRPDDKHAPAREWAPAQPQQDARPQPGAAPQQGQAPRNSEARGRPQHHSRSQQDARTAGDTRLQQDARYQQPQRQWQRQASAPYLFFGDSFVRLFTLVRHPDIKVAPLPSNPRARPARTPRPLPQVTAYKGATAKGLTRDGNENRADIEQQLAARGGGAAAAVFVFGSVDVHLSFYYNRYVKGSDIDLEGIARDYVAFVAGAGGASGAARRVIVGPYAPRLETGLARH